LDYPPLSAYHSYFVGKLFQRVLPESLFLGSSRGYESPIHKFWMRVSVALSDLLIPTLVIFHLIFSRANGNHPVWASVLLAVSAPPLILIDYCHFQYNCVSLGLTVLATIAILRGHMSIGAIFFTLAVNHKQMSLYHAIPFFVQMVSVILIKRGDLFTAFRVGLMVISTMILMWMPFGDTWPHVLRRVFPVKRGVFEDKVGTFWYALDRVVPFRNMFPDSDLAGICGMTTLAMLLPGIVHLFVLAIGKKTSLQNGQRVFLLSLLNVSLIFFLFSYHVHEKSIMLPVLPAVLLIGWYPHQMVWFITAASLSLYPLLLEEGSHLALVCTTSFFVLIAHQIGAFKKLTGLLRLIFMGSIAGYVVLILGLHFIPPPKRLPHLFQVGIALYSFIHYAGFSWYFHSVQFDLGRLPGDKKQSAAAVKTKTKGD